MKTLLVTPVLFCIIVTSCNGLFNNNSAAHGGKTYTANTSITKANACNSLFIDTAALENYIREKQAPEDVADQLRSFYYDRNFEFAWFDLDGLTEQGRECWNLYTYSVSSLKDSTAFNRALNKRMPNITAADSLSIQPGDTAIAGTELMLTEAFVKMVSQGGNHLSANTMQLYIPAKKDDIMHAAETILSNDDEPGGQNNDADNAFKQLKNELRKYYGIAKKGGWQHIPYTGKKWKKGRGGAIIPLVKKRLALTGEYTGEDSSAAFDLMLDMAVRAYQENMGYTADGILSDSLIKDMNVPVKKRIEQLFININRVRWMPALTDGRLIIVNIPEYELHVYENKQKAFDMNVVVGKEGAGTVIFTGNLNEIVFSPYWNIPPSIVRKEIVPKMNENPNYLEEQHMEITGHSNGLPIVRQLPGKQNSLGLVKFLFHNSYNIYFHDTPAKELFEKDKRAYSHGCIRLADPVKMANYLLDDNDKWTPDKITEAMDAGKEKYVTLKKSVPVIITYYTAWVGEDGRLNLRDDIYNHDYTVAQKMFTDAE